jgi:hypothetical protein
MRADLYRRQGLCQYGCFERNAGGIEDAHPPSLQVGHLLTGDRARQAAASAGALTQMRSSPRAGSASYRMLLALLSRTMAA